MLHFVSYKPKLTQRGALPRLRPDSYPSSFTELVLPRPRPLRPLRPLPTLPPDVLIIIMNHVYERRTLAQCCLAARVALYSTLDLDLKSATEEDERSPRPHTTALDTIANSPHLTSLVRRLDLVPPRVVADGEAWDFGTMEPLLVRGLALLPHVEHFEICVPISTTRTEGAAALFDAVAAGRQNIRVLSFGAYVFGTEESDQRQFDSMGNLLRQRSGGLEELTLNVTPEADAAPTGSPPTFELSTLKIAIARFCPHFFSFITT